MDVLRCVVERITYQNEQNGYTIIKCKAKGYQDLVTVVGAMPDVHVGSVLSLEGFWKVDGKYGRQFSVRRWEETLPATVYGIEKYLGSGLIKGIGPRFAGRIVHKFGADTLEVIETAPDRLLEVAGIGKKRVERVKKSWQEQKEIKNIMLFLQSNDVSTSHATKIYKTYGKDSIAVVKENPYRLADDIWGIGFRTTDTIAKKLGVRHDRYVRLRSGLLYTLNKLSENGHCFSDREMLLKTGAEMLEVEKLPLAAALDRLIMDRDVITETMESREAIYLPPFFFAESGCARKIAGLLSAKRSVQIDADRVLTAVKSRPGIRYDEVQLSAIRMAVMSKIAVLTGGPGTGKTTTTLGIISACREAGCRILLAAPTGRAAKRLSEASGMEAKTIHRLLEFKPPEGYQKNEEQPLEGDVLILDECSMIDTMLMFSLLKAIPEAMTLILVGDTDQLPSVGAGNVLKDIISSGTVPVVRLTRIFRQAQGSRIIMNAHRINAGKPIDMRNGRDADFFFAAQETPEAAADLIIRYCKTNLPRYYGVDPFRDIQVLAPMQRGIVGAANLNQVLQEALNPSSLFLKRGGTQYRLHDKVMQIRNDYDKEVFNGDIGTIVRVDTEERELAVEFDDRKVTYDISELDELTLAYATTIHKAQGSEYPIVVMPIMMTHFVMLQRNLLYTGVTRAKKICILVGEKAAVSYAIRNVSVQDRNTRLSDRLKAECGVQKKSDVIEDAAASPRGISCLESGRPIETGQSQAVGYSSISGQSRLMTEAEAAEKKRSAGDSPRKDIVQLFGRLGSSKFRSRFFLIAKDREYVREKGMDMIREHALNIIGKRIAPAVIPNDGRQTPMKGHPVFVAQHATATCCRSCLLKWHGIPQGRELTQEEQAYVADVIMEWIRRQLAVNM